MCIRSRWSVTLNRVCIYILGLILPDFVFRKNPKFDWNSHFRSTTVFLGVKYENWILWSLTSSSCLCLLCEWQKSLAHFFEHNQLFEALESTYFCTFITIQAPNRSEWPKMSPLEPPTTPTKPPILGQRVKNIQFCK